MKSTFQRSVPAITAVPEQIPTPTPASPNPPPSPERTRRPSTEPRPGPRRNSSDFLNQRRMSNTSETDTGMSAAVSTGQRKRRTSSISFKNPFLATTAEVTSDAGPASPGESVLSALGYPSNPSTRRSSSALSTSSQLPITNSVGLSSLRKTFLEKRPLLLDQFREYGTQRTNSFEKHARLYGEHGKLIDYNTAKVTRSSIGTEWAERQKILPKEAKVIVDNGTGTAGAAVRLGQHYPQANILAVDFDPESAGFIKRNISSGKALNEKTALQNPEHIRPFTGTLELALANGEIEKGTVDLIVMDNLTVYLNDEQLEATLRQAYDALAPNGTVVFTAYGEHHLPDTDVGKNFHRRTDRALIGMLEETGLTMSCIGNKLQNDQENLEKNVRDLTELETGEGAMPNYDPSRTYWHTVLVAATKISDVD